MIKLISVSLPWLTSCLHQWHTPTLQLATPNTDNFWKLDSWPETINGMNWLIELSFIRIQGVLCSGYGVIPNTWNREKKVCMYTLIMMQTMSPSIKWTWAISRRGVGLSVEMDDVVTRVMNACAASPPAAANNCHCFFLLVFLPSYSDAFICVCLQGDLLAELTFVVEMIKTSSLASTLIIWGGCDGGFGGYRFQFVLIDYLAAYFKCFNQESSLNVGLKPRRGNIVVHPIYCVMDKCQRETH